MKEIYRNQNKVSLFDANPEEYKIGDEVYTGNATHILINDEDIQAAEAWDFPVYISEMDADVVEEIEKLIGEIFGYGVNYEKQQVKLLTWKEYGEIDIELKTMFVTWQLPLKFTKNLSITLDGDATKMKHIWFEDGKEVFSTDKNFYDPICPLPCHCPHNSDEGKRIAEEFLKLSIEFDLAV